MVGEKEDHTMAAQRIVVGVDGSHQSRHALKWAMAEARLRGGRVEAVHSWRYPAWTYSPAIVAPPVFAHDDLVAEARSVLEEAVNAVLKDEDNPPEIEQFVREGSAAEQLVDHAQDADLLVVGHRGRGGFAGLLLGSVAHQCAAHASCPVVVVR
jgi:nucleotide-binding universal stress UspA family protein